MLGVVHSALTRQPPAGVAASRKPAALEAQLQTCKAQLSDWVNCPSAKTPEGKAKIEQISAKVDDIHAQMKRAAERAALRPATAQAAMGEGASRAADGRLSFDGLGQHLDLFA